ncbi:uncharacterized protein MCYG_07260 [Microsporum canis CBS 113480]|uniref:Uncharacterized protein n=1 Tax=Arthroderma otae (strain ATCC MYA-4605 / CBS 113480) TaxID=554155 RepID=C5FY43_ARTOC|nr:uncharacterized protein MCYG_07260 [Microsporum canis CBS 113480]EEQ34441.1 predicted protein [Microsporum canis CBS 113480]
MQLHWIVTLLFASSAIAGVVDTFAAPGMSEALGIRDVSLALFVCQPTASSKDLDLTINSLADVMPAATVMIRKCVAHALDVYATAIDADRPDYTYPRMGNGTFGNWSYALEKLDLGICS